MTILIITLLLSFLCNTNSQDLDVTSSLSTVEALTTYNKWKSSNKRQYMNEDEQIFRQSVFLDNLKKMNEHNSNLNNTYTVGLNQFSDMTDEEFVSTILMSRLPENEIVAASDDVQKITRAATTTTATIANSIDWRTSGAVSSIRNQGRCGSCGVFSAVALMESVSYLKSKKMVDFSEQQMLDCVISENGFSGYGCSGGFPGQSLKYSQKFGIVNESQYPYVSVQGKCKVTSVTQGFKPQNIKLIGQTSDDLKKALSVSPVSALVDASNFNKYKTGVFSDCGTVLNHGVLVIGYDVSGNWIVKNSWGSNWGENGFMKIAPGPTCGILQSMNVITA